MIELTKVENELTVVENELTVVEEKETVNEKETIKETVNNLNSHLKNVSTKFKSFNANSDKFTGEFSIVNKDYPARDNLNKVFCEQLSIARQMQEILLSISSFYDMSIQFPDAAYAVATQSLFLDLFRPLEIFNDKDEASRKFNEILIPLQQRFKESDGSHFPWLKSKRFKTKTFASDLCINDKFYPRCFEKQELILDVNGKKMGINSPNVSLPADIRVKWYVDRCHDLFYLKLITVDSLNLHLHVFASSMKLPELTQRVLGGDM